VTSVAKDSSQPVRCGRANGELLIRYHDEEWGVPVHDGTLFEFLILEGAQAGLSWNTILNKRDHYRKVFDGFDPQRVARTIGARWTGGWVILASSAIN